MSNEAKLPKWAREALEEARTRAALSWPTETEPTPVCIGNDASGEVTGDRSDADLWAFNRHTSRVSPTFLRRGFTHPERPEDGYKGWGSRFSGPLYATRAEALTALRWAVARDCAIRLRAVDFLASEESTT